MMTLKPGSWVLFALLLASALSGCLGPGEASDDDGPPADPDETEQEEREPVDDDPESDGNETEDDDPPGNGDGDGDGNETDEGDDDNETVHYNPGWPEAENADIRPGVSIAGGCTANFIFSSPDNRTLYIGTASHCVGGMAPNTTVAIAGGYSGTLVYCSWMFTEGEDKCAESEGLILDFNDFALVRIDEEDRDEVHPGLLHWGGPKVPGSGPHPVGTKTLSYGNSKPGVLRPIEGYVIQSNEVHTTMYAFAPGIPGDSGSPVVRGDGSAVGVLIGVGTAPFPASNAVANLDNSLAYMTEQIGLEVELKTWELLAPPLLP